MLTLTRSVAARPAGRDIGKSRRGACLWWGESLLRPAEDHVVKTEQEKGSVPVCV